MDLDEYRRASLERWSAAAPRWEAQRAGFARATAPVSQWLVEAVDPQPGQRVLELAAGIGDVGFLAAELLRPGGTLISTDGSEAMVDAARRRAAELGLDNVEFRVMGAEWIDLPAGDVDAVLCRWGFMLLADPGAAVRECRRVLRSGGRLALAAWAGREHNPWTAILHEEVVRLGAAEPPAAGMPGMFALAEAEALRELLEEGGFVDPAIDQVGLTFAFADLDEFWDVQLDMSAWLRDAVTAVGPEQRDTLRDRLDARLAPWVAADGAVALPGRTHVVVAEA